MVDIEGVDLSLLNITWKIKMVTFRKGTNQTEIIINDIAIANIKILNNYDLTISEYHAADQDIKDIINTDIDITNIKVQSSFESLFKDISIADAIISCGSIEDFKMIYIDGFEDVEEEKQLTTWFDVNTKIDLLSETTTGTAQTQHYLREAELTRQAYFKYEKGFDKSGNLTASSIRAWEKHFDCEYPSKNRDKILEREESKKRGQNMLLRGIRDM